MKMFVYKTNDENLKAKGRKVFSELDPDKEFLVTIKQNRPVRSLSHNGYYRICLKVIAIHTGETEDRLHMLFKTMFNADHFPLPNGDVMRIPRTTTDLDVAEFSKYISQVKQWAIDEFSVSFPERHDVDRMVEMDIENNYDKIQG